MLNKKNESLNNQTYNNGNITYKGIFGINIIWNNL